jgi:Matrixin
MRPQRSPRRGKLLRFPVAGLLAGLVVCAVGSAVADDSASFKALRLEGNGVRWQSAAKGQQRILSYAIAALDVEFAGARNCGKMTKLDGLLSASRIAPETVRAEIAAAFAMWEAVANIGFREAEDPASADILIGAQLEPEGWAFANVFYDTLSSDPVKPISRALICLNPEKRWKVGFDGDLRTYDVRYTIAHEIGHTIGLDHPSGGGQIMGYRYEETFRQLQRGDVAGAVLLYGKRQPDSVVADAEPTLRARHPSAVRLYAKRWGTRAFTARSP